MSQLKFQTFSSFINYCVLKILVGYFLLVIGLTCGFATGSEAQTNHQGSTILRLERNVIVDYTGFGQPIPAITLFTPVGWKSSGGVEWGNQYSCTKGFAFNWKITSQDELTGAAILPQQGWGYNSIVESGEATPGCQIRQIYDVQSYLSVLLQSTRPDATNLQFRARPDLVAEIPNNQWSRPWQLGMEYFTTEGGELSFNVIENGVTLDVRLMVAVEFTKTVTTVSYTHLTLPTIYSV